MKQTTLIFALVAALASPVFAAEDAQRPASKSGEIAGANSEQMMEKMYRHMTAMEAMMKDLRETQDPAQHRAMMHKHMAMMREGINMMNSMHGGRDEMGMGMHGDESELYHGAAMLGGTDMPVEKRMETMQTHLHGMGQHMRMMQMMMDQMMAHQQEAEKQ